MSFLLVYFGLQGVYSTLMNVNTQQDKYGKHNSRTISLRLSLADYSRLEAAAKRDNMSPGQFGRDAVLEEVRISEEQIMAG